MFLDHIKDEPSAESYSLMVRAQFPLETLLKDISFGNYPLSSGILSILASMTKGNGDETSLLSVSMSIVENSTAFQKKIVSRIMEERGETFERETRCCSF